MRKLNQTGFSAVEGLLILIIVAILGATGFYVYHANKQTNDINNTATKVAQSSPPKGSTKKIASKSSQTPQAYFTIKEWGVKAPYNGNLTLEYSVNTSGSSQYAAFSSGQLDAADPKCKVDLTQGGGYGGTISRYKSTDLVYPSPDSSGETVQQYIAATGSTNKKLGDYYYIYSHPQAACSDSNSAQNLQNQTNDVVESLVQNLQSVPAAQ